jgi:signal transduction histidine kinase
MTHHNEPDLLNTVLHLLTTQGSSNLAECFRLLFHEALESHPWVGLCLPEATKVKISLEHRDQSIRLTIEDNGKGLPNHAGDIIHSPILGMVGMRARARQSGGELTAISIMPQGLRIEVVIPLQSQPA